MKKVLKILSILIVISNIAFITVFAFNTGAYNTTGTGWNDELSKMGGKIIYVFQRVGTYFAAGVLAFIGIQYMLASPSEKADIKGRAVPYIVGAVMVFAIVKLLQIVYNILN